MDEKYIVYWWNYGDQDSYKHEYDSLTEAIEFYNNLIRDEDVGRVSIRWGNTEIQGMITEQYLKESENKQEPVDVLRGEIIDETIKGLLDNY